MKNLNKILIISIFISISNIYADISQLKIKKGLVINNQSVDNKNMKLTYNANDQTAQITDLKGNVLYNFIKVNATTGNPDTLKLASGTMVIGSYFDSSTAKSPASTNRTRSNAYVGGTLYTLYGTLN